MIYYNNINALPVQGHASLMQGIINVPARPCPGRLPPPRSVFAAAGRFLVQREPEGRKAGRLC